MDTGAGSPHLTGTLLPRCTFPPAGTSVHCAVSGGPDSMALLVLAVAAGLDVTAVHVDHGIRPGSSADVDVIEPVVRRLGASLVVHTVDVGPGPNLEARARAARYAVFPVGTMTGHTADDQAETVLLNLMRGAGTTGLSAMRPGRDRPLLGLRRSETHALCDSMGITCVHDVTNHDPVHQRNRVRHELLPLLTNVSLRDPVPILVRAAGVMRDDNDLLEELASSIDPTDALALAAAPLPLARRAVRRWLSDPYPPDRATVERVLEVARGLHPGCDVGGNRQIRRSKQRMHIVNLR
ncbi:MAG: tRNA lysidine(34) synthetase TilS [Acidimicrobiales bacterium]